MRRILAGVLIALGLILLGAWWQLHYYFASTRPKHPNYVTQSTHELNVHGSIVYLNEHEDFLLTGTFVASAMCWVAGGLLWRRR
jgi:hypothetical protein